MERVLRFIDNLSELQGKVFSFLIFVATLQICYELTRRYAFNAPTSWGLELTEYLCAVTYIMGGAYAHRFDAHIRVDILYMHWSPRTKALVDIFVTNVFFFFFVGVLVWQSSIWTLEALERHATSGTVWDPPVWPMRLSLFLGAVFLALQGIAKLIRDIYTAFGKRAET